MTKKLLEFYRKLDRTTDREEITFFYEKGKRELPAELRSIFAYRVFEHMTMMDDCVFPDEMWEAVLSDASDYARNPHATLCPDRSNPRETLTLFGLCKVSSDIFEKIVRHPVIGNVPLSPSHCTPEQLLFYLDNGPGGCECSQREERCCHRSGPGPKTYAHVKSFIKEVSVFTDDMNKWKNMLIVYQRFKDDPEFDLASFKKIISEAFSRRLVKTIRFILEHGAEAGITPNFLGRNGYSLIYWYVQPYLSGRLDSGLQITLDIIKFMIELGADLHQLQPDGCTLLDCLKRDYPKIYNAVRGPIVWRDEATNTSYRYETDASSGQARLQELSEAGVSEYTGIAREHGKVAEIYKIVGDPIPEDCVIRNQDGTYSVLELVKKCELP